MSRCCICNRGVAEDAPVLTMGRYGTPRLLCGDCALRIETVTVGRDRQAIAAAMDRLSLDMAEAGCEDPVTFEAMKELLDGAAARAKAIEEGSYDFSLDEAEAADGPEEVPQELLETPEERALTEAEKAEEARVNRIMNWLWLGFAAGIVAALVYVLFFR